MYKRGIIIAVLLLFILPAVTAESEQHIYGGRDRYGWSISNLDENITYNYTFEITIHKLFTFDILHHYNESGNSSGIIASAYYLNLPRFARVVASLRIDDRLILARGYVIFKFVWFRELKVMES